jgi:hypothetical protein
MILSFTYQCEGYTGTDYGMVSFSSNGGSTWNDLPTQYYNTSSCTKASITVPAVYNGISNFRIGFRWVNGTSGNGNNPPFAINNISLGSFSMVLGCSTEDSVQIKVDSLPGVKLSASTNPICIGDTSTLRISGGTSYQWNTGSTASSINVSPSVTTTYTVYVNDGTCSGDTSITVTVNTCTGIQEIYSNSSVAIYPNPNNGAFTVSIQTLTGKPTTEIFNVFGQLIYTETLIKADTEVDLRMQPKGIYFCRIVDENGAELYSSKLIVQ